jgi:hypothetical protein
MQTVAAALGMISLAISRKVLAADLAVAAVEFGGNGTLDDADELAAYFSTAACRFSSAWWPAAAMMVSWYSTDRISSTSSSIQGYMDRSSASEHPVHSPKCSQITGGRWAGAANTSATLGTNDDESPMVAVRAVQYFMKSRRRLPFPPVFRKTPFFPFPSAPP